MRKKNTHLLVFALILSTIAIPVYASSPNKDVGMPPSYVLNILAKKNFTENEMTTSPDRHTIFVPLYGDAKIYVTQAPPKEQTEFQVLDANAVNDGIARLELGQGYYKVYMAALGKPAKNGESADIWSIIENTQYDVYVELAEFNIKRSKGGPEWMDTTDLLYMDWDEVYSFYQQYFTTLYLSDPYEIPDGYTVEEYIAYLAEFYTSAFFDLFADMGLLNADGKVWVFDFFEYIEEFMDIMGSEYYWLIKNNGVRHIQLRFYKVKDRNWEFPTDYVLPEPVN